MCLYSNCIRDALSCSDFPCNCVLSLCRQSLDKHIHFFLADWAIAVYVNQIESLFETLFIERALKYDLDKALALNLFELSAAIIVKLKPNFVDKLLSFLVFETKFRRTVFFWEELLFVEKVLVEEDFNVAWETLPSDRILIFECFSVNYDHLVLNLLV